MSREKQIVDALRELSLTKVEVKLTEIEHEIERRFGEKLPESWRQVARQVLRTMSGLGLVKLDGHDDIRLSYHSIKLTDDFLSERDGKPAYLDRPVANQRTNSSGAIGDSSTEEPAISSTPTDSDAGGGGDGDDRDGGLDEGDGGNGGAGFREVLTHPYLFSLTEADLNQVLNEI